MVCKICGRAACTESFHSFQEQEEFDMKERGYVPSDQLTDADERIASLEQERDQLRAEVERLRAEVEKDKE